MTVPPLIRFGDRWKLDGDYLRCRACNRPQIVSAAHEAFHHRSGCKGEGWETNPWKTLGSLINASISRASDEAMRTTIHDANQIDLIDAIEATQNTSREILHTA